MTGPILLALAAIQAAPTHPVPPHSPESVVVRIWNADGREPRLVHQIPLPHDGGRHALLVAGFWRTYPLLDSMRLTLSGETLEIDRDAVTYTVGDVAGYRRDRLGQVPISSTFSVELRLDASGRARRAFHYPAEGGERHVVVEVLPASATAAR